MLLQLLSENGPNTDTEPIYRLSRWRAGCNGSHGSGSSVGYDIAFTFASGWQTLREAKIPAKSFLIYLSISVCSSPSVVVGVIDRTIEGPSASWPAPPETGMVYRAPGLLGPTHTLSRGFRLGSLRRGALVGNVGPLRRSSRPELLLLGLGRPEVIEEMIVVSSS